MKNQHSFQTTAYTIMREIGNEELLRFIRSALPEHEFNSHVFIERFQKMNPNLFVRMQNVYAEYGEIRYRNQKVSTAIGQYLWHNRNSLHIEKIRAEKSENINGTISLAAVWHTTL